MSGELDAQARAIIQGLSAGRIDQLAAELGVKLAAGSRDQRANRLAAAMRNVEPLDFFGRLRREELRAACRQRGLPWRARSRVDLTTTLLGRHVDAPTIARHFRPWSPAPDADQEAGSRLPRTGEIVRVRHRQYLVEDVSVRDGEQTLVGMVGLDDDDAGRTLEVLWELELGAQVVRPEAQGLGAIEKLDPPRLFSAYFHALRWGCTTATDPHLFQAPFRAGIRLRDSRHQLVPLRKALELPRVNLFIADDVGVGKTIEAGLIMQELLLRQHIDRVLVVAPAAVTLQWREELERRFGQRFEVYGRAFVARRRQERGFGVNAWATFPRFVVSYQTIRRPEHWEPLLAYLGEQARRNLLILDEAHTAAPASSGRYAVDSDITWAVRQLAPRFEHRLFLSATPHNGHSNSFSSLLELLDPQRFTRGVPVSPAHLAPVMVRRLKTDLIRRGVGKYPRRIIRQMDLVRDQGRWHEEVREGDRMVERHDLGPGTDVELELSLLLTRYRSLVDVHSKRARLVLVNLQKRLLSSVEAFARTLARHAEALDVDGSGRYSATAHPSLPGPTPDQTVTSDGEAVEDEDLATLEDALIETGSQAFPRISQRAQLLLEEMLKKARQWRAAPSPKVLSLLAWIRRHQCAAVALGGAAGGQPTNWSSRRIIVFTEYVDTKRYLAQILRTAFDGTERGEERLLELHGGLSDDQRDAISVAFNGDPEQHPVRVLLATDAAREGLNLHGRCADLVHFDAPWNPARLEQRNGRIDRAMQPEPDVRCGYFFFPQREEDLVLRKLVEKTETIRTELGSLGAVVMDRLAEALSGGIEAGSADQVEAATRDGNVGRTQEELAPAIQDPEEEKVGEILNRSQEFISYSPELLRSVVDAGLTLGGQGRLEPARWDVATRAGVSEAFVLPDLEGHEGWVATVDTLRPPRRPDEPLWAWREKPAKPVVFEAPERISDEVAQLHLSHPLVQRILARFRAQGWAAHDLGRVTVLRNPKDALTRVVAIGRLTLFGPGAIRLHEQMVFAAARWIEGKQANRLKPFAEKADTRAVERLGELLAEAPDEITLPKAVERKLIESAPADFAALWPQVEAQAETLQHEAATQLADRARVEAAALAQILADQRRTIERALADRQVPITFSAAEKAQLEADRRHLAQRLDQIGREEQQEPARIGDRYRVVLKRLEPVGLVYLYPALG